MILPFLFFFQRRGFISGQGIEAGFTPMVTIGCNNCPVSNPGSVSSLTSVVIAGKSEMEVPANE